jgi:hypothetical protein
MDTKDAGRIGGSSKSERKKAASAANLAKAREKVAKALIAFNKARLDAEDAGAVPPMFPNENGSK